MTTENGKSEISNSRVVSSVKGDGEGGIAAASPNTNVLYPATCIPFIKYPIKAGTQKFTTTVTGDTIA